ncbi:MAG: hypothetical protein ACK41D_00805 [Rubricoccaceae bacterium]
MALSDSDLARVADALGVPAEDDGGRVRFALAHAASGRRLAVEVAPAVALPDGTQTALVSVYSTGAFLQLHGCTGVMASAELGEVIFFARQGERVSGLVVEREAGCSLYASVDERLLSADFVRLPPEVMMSAVALSLSEPLFDDGALPE